MTSRGYVQTVGRPGWACYKCGGRLLANFSQHRIQETAALLAQSKRPCNTMYCICTSCRHPHNGWNYVYLPKYKYPFGIPVAVNFLKTYFAMPNPKLEDILQQVGCQGPVQFGFFIRGYAMQKRVLERNS